MVALWQWVSHITTNIHKLLVPMIYDNIISILYHMFYHIFIIYLSYFVILYHIIAINTHYTPAAHISTLVHPGGRNGAATREPGRGGHGMQHP